MADREPQNNSGFFLLWAYLMVLSIALAPVAAHIIKSALYAAFGEEMPDG